jgi:hypothetical protein
MFSVLVESLTVIVGVLLAPFIVQGLIKSKSKAGRIVQGVAGVVIVVLFATVWGETGKDPVQLTYCSARYLAKGVVAQPKACRPAEAEQISLKPAINAANAAPASPKLIPAPATQAPAPQPIKSKSDVLDLSGTPEQNRQVIMSSLQGRWSGKLKCDGEEFQFSLLIERVTSSYVDAVLSYYPLNAALSNVRATMGGEYDPLTDQIRIGPRAYKLDTIYPIPTLAGVYSYERGKKLSGTVYDANEKSCGLWSIAPGDEDPVDTGEHAPKSQRGTARIGWHG